MNDRVWVELLSKRGEVVARTRFDALPIRVGRAYRNEVLLDDRAVSDAHLVIDRAPQGGLVARAVAGRTFRVAGAAAHVAEAHLDADTILRIGDARLRVRTADCILEPSHGAVAGWLRRPAALRVAGFVPLLLAAIVMVIGAWLGNPRDPSLWGALSGRMPALAIAAGWIAAWALASQAFRQTPEVERHARVAGSVLLVHAALAQLLPVLVFAANLEAPVGLQRVMDVAALGVAVHLHLAILRPSGRRGLDLAYAGVVGIGMLVAWYWEHRQSEMDGAAPNIAVLYPTSWQLGNPVPVGTFLGKLRAMEQRVATTLKEPLPDDP